jgi:hypothetical protein
MKFAHLAIWIFELCSLVALILGCAACSGYVADQGSGGGATSVVPIVPISASCQ